MIIVNFLDPITEEHVCEMKLLDMCKFYDLKSYIMMALDKNPSNTSCTEYIKLQYPELEPWCIKLEKIDHPQDSVDSINYYLEDYITEFFIVSFYSDQRHKVMTLVESSLSESIDSTSESSKVGNLEEDSPTPEVEESTPEVLESSTPGGLGSL